MRCVTLRTSWEGRENRPRSRHCDRPALQVVADAHWLLMEPGRDPATREQRLRSANCGRPSVRKPARACDCWHSSRERVWLQPHSFSWGFFVGDCVMLRRLRSIAIRSAGLAAVVAALLCATPLAAQSSAATLETTDETGRHVTIPQPVR